MVTSCGDRVGPEGEGAAGPRGADVHSVSRVGAPWFVADHHRPGGWQQQEPVTSRLSRQEAEA